LIRGLNREGPSEVYLLAIGEKTSGREDREQSYEPDPVLSLSKETEYGIQGTDLGHQTGMSNEWFEDQETSLKLRPSGGLLSVKELWVNIHYPTTVR
jgi:hypothetical protein